LVAVAVGNAHKLQLQTQQLMMVSVGKSLRLALPQLQVLQSLMPLVQVEQQALPVMAVSVAQPHSQVQHLP
jgi:hypothetical protein